MSVHKVNALKTEMFKFEISNFNMLGLYILETFPTWVRSMHAFVFLYVRSLLIAWYHCVQKVSKPHYFFNSSKFITQLECMNFLRHENDPNIFTWGWNLHHYWSKSCFMNCPTWPLFTVYPLGWWIPHRYPPSLTHMPEMIMAWLADVIAREACYTLLVQDYLGSTTHPWWAWLLV